MGLNSKLFTKIMGASISNLPKEVRKCAKASTYNFVSGTGKKGDFQIYSFFDKFGNLIKRHRTFIKGSDITREVSYYKDYKQPALDFEGTILQTTIYKEINGKLQNCKNTIQYGTLAKTEEEISQGTKHSNHRMLGLHRGKKPKEISYKTDWDGNIPYDVQITGGDFTLPDGAEYVPIFTSPQNPKRFEHLEQIALSQQELRGIVPKVKILSRKQFYEEYPYVKAYEKAHGEGALVGGNACPITGQVKIVNDEKDIIQLVDTFAHEYQHVRYYSDLIRTQHALANALKMEQQNIRPIGFRINYNLNEFKTKSLEKGLIEKGSDEYNRLISSRWIEERENYDELCRVGEHDDAFSELFAIQKGTQEANRFTECINKIFEFLLN